MLKRFVLPCAAAAFAAVGIAGFATAPARADDDIAAKAQGCNACHGQNGTPISANFPIIWGQEGNYLYKELHDFHSGDRSSPIMAPLVQGTSLDELRALANYFAAKPWPEIRPGQQTASTAAGAAATPPPQAIADKIQMCKACHQANFEGGAPAPRLAGLSYEYLRSAMNAFADGTRTNNLDMPGFMKALTPSDRDAIAHYLAGL